MIRRSTWITLGVFVLLVGFTFYWTNFRPPQVTTESTPLPGSPWSIALSDIVTVEILDLKQGDLLELSRISGGNWVQTAPAQGSVDAGVVEGSLSWLASPKINREISTEGGLEQFGLAEPAGVIRVFTVDGQERTLLIGDVSPIGDQTYTIIPNTYRVLLISKYDVNSIMDLVGMELLLSPLPESTQTDMETEVP